MPSSRSHHQAHEEQSRASVTALIQRPHAQVLVVGGGINGISIFRDLALQGVDVILVERNDYCSGASAASSHMIHGGVRYLENGEFRLVRESVQERNRLLRLAPHYVKPLETTIPIFSTFSGILAAPLRLLTHRQRTPKERGALLIKIGLVLYDSFSRDGGSVPRHRVRGRAASLAELPRLNPDVRYTATYFDASVHDPERLALDLLMDGEDIGPNARASNYVEAIGAVEGGVVLRDGVGGDTFTVTADVVINASGPWTDLTDLVLGKPTDYMGGTRGSHIVLDNPELLAACASRELFFENNDGRIVLIYPLNGRILVGTTDLEADVTQRAVCTEEEIQYFFDLISHVFPTVPVDRSDIVFTFSGIRPLPKHEDTQPGFVSRDYRVESGVLPSSQATTLLSVVGGKWTTFRALGERVSDMALAALGMTRTRNTRELAIGGGREYPATANDRRSWISANATTAVPAARVEQLFARYGTRAGEVIRFLEENDDQPLPACPQLSTAEIQFLIERESVVRLSDVVLRRTGLAFAGNVTLPILDAISRELASVLGWTEEQRQEEVASTVGELTNDHGAQI
ncbi:glycerol-3-phosphate dehydrogenase/oxidase [Parafrigoribacterium soli]|uniref:glycerol-3-phosphate dehydrogenase/oxidase n=1 Tax=Parafrigoribacterium soli TaxID=3144663 RepID=UPI00387EB724